MLPNCTTKLAIGFYAQTALFTTMTVDLEPLLAVFRRWLAVREDTVVELLAGFWLAHQLPSDPVWFILVGPSSDAKTELLRAFSVHNTVVMNKVTARTIISGRTDGASSLFMKRMNNRIWAVFDISNILALYPQDRKMVFAQMRDLYDGHLTAGYGTAKTVDERIYTSFIAAATPRFEETFAEQQALGTRHLIVKTMPPTSESVFQHIRNQLGNEDMMRYQMAEVVRSTFEDYSPEWVRADDKTEARLQTLVKIVTTLRTFVQFDTYRNEVSAIVDKEGVGRAKKNFDKLYSGLMNIASMTPDHALDLIAHVAKSNASNIRYQTLLHLYRSEDLRPQELSEYLRVGVSTAYRHLRALYALGIIERLGEREKYALTDQWRDYQQWFAHDLADLTVPNSADNLAQEARLAAEKKDAQRERQEKRAESSRRKYLMY